MTDPYRRPGGPRPSRFEPRRPTHPPALDATDEFALVAEVGPPLDHGDIPDPAKDHTLPPHTPTAWGRFLVVLVTAFITGGLLLVSGLPRWVFTLAVLALQLVLVAAYVRLRKPAGPMVIGLVGVMASLVADWIALASQPLSLDNLMYVIAGAFGLAIVGQLFRTDGRTELTVSLGSAVFVAASVCGYATWIGLLRQPGGLAAMWIGAIAIGAAIMAARACDITLPKPRINRQVPRGAFGVVIGAMVGTAVAAYAATVLDGPTPPRAALGGLVIGLVAVLADLAVGYIQAGRRIAGEGVALWPVRHSLGPVLAFGAVAPVAYLLSVYYIARG
ncbi:MAG TPA: hypothetical protein VE172_11865 [Stackebrandtia sp.]|uniref:hypothetical protein n=1 Tax=Stackebrandtia sp. TaxID=2023065 RepID=UPI002D751B3D|nr:hypothetical protein [Stackebrandtia sp.]HZE39495.1 hypothetical protein [Stackebrandtia sp.]